MKNSIAAVSILLASAAAWVRPAQGPILDPDAREFLRHIRMYDAPIDYAGHTVRTVEISGLNVQIVNGTGQTDGWPNGVGNLIIGYNEEPLSGFVRSGSHNLVIGYGNAWWGATSGIVAGTNNTLFGSEGSSVLGGGGNTAMASYCVVVGGSGNSATGDESVLGGGQYRSVNGTDDFAAGSLYEDH